MTEEHVDIFAAERRMLFAMKVDELALLMVGESADKVVSAIDVVRESLEDELTDKVIDLFLQAILLRKIQLDRNAVSARLQ